MGGCLPSEEEAGAWVLFSSPVAVLAGLILLWPLYRLWGRLLPELSFRMLPTLLLAAALLNGASVKAVLNPSLLKGTGAGLWIFGTSYLAVLLVVWRVWLWRRPRSSFTWVSLTVAAIYVAPAVHYAYHGSSTQEIPEIILNAWMLPGYGGWVPVPLFAALLMEAWICTRPRRQRERPKPLARKRPAL